MDQLNVALLPFAVLAEVIECLTPTSQSFFRSTCRATDEAFDAVATGFGVIPVAATVVDDSSVVDGDTTLRRWFPVGKPRACAATHHLRVHVSAFVRWICGKEPCDAIAGWGAGTAELHGFARDTALPNGFLKDSPNLKRLHFHGKPLQSVEDAVSHNVASDCPQLVSVTSNGLPVETFTRLGHGWLTECYSLTSVDCRVLSQVKSVGRNFLSFNTRLAAINLDLPQLQGVDDMFLAASGADEVTFGPTLEKLLVVRNMCLWNATKLTRVTLQGLPELQVIGDLFIGLSTVRHVVLAELPALSGIGVECLLECDQLETAEFRNMPNLRVVGDYWMAGCMQLHQLLIVNLHPEIRIGSTMLTEANPLVVANVDGKVAAALPSNVSHVVV